MLRGGDVLRYPQTEVASAVPGVPAELFPGRLQGDHGQPVCAAGHDRRGAPGPGRYGAWSRAALSLSADVGVWVILPVERGAGGERVDLGLCDQFLWTCSRLGN